jgi:hypothetical protein
MVEDFASLAVLLDEVRPLIARAREQGERPRYVVVSKEAYDAVAAVKESDRERGMPLMVLGMEIVLADAPIERPKVF